MVEADGARICASVEADTEPPPEEVAGMTVSTTIVLLANRFRAGAKLVMALPSVEVMVPDTFATFKAAMFCPPVTIWVQ